MRDSESAAVKSHAKRSRSRADTDSNSVVGSTITNGKDEARKRQNLKQAKMSKSSMGASNSRTKESGSKESSSFRFKGSGSGSRKGDKKSPELRPRRRASQTYFFKYQLAKNPLKAEEEDLRLALLASLQQCGNGSDDNRKSPSTAKKLANTANASKNSIQSQTSASKRSAIRSLENSSPSHSSASSLSLLSSTASEITRVTSKESAKKSPNNTQQYKLNGSNSSNGKRRGSVESSSSSIGSSLKDGTKKKLSKDISLLAKSQTGGHPKVQPKLGLTTSCSDFTSVQNRIKKAKKVLQNKKANESKRSTIISKYSALRKFPSNSSPAISNRNTSLLSPTRKPKNGSKVNNYYCNNLSTANFNTTSANQCFVPYSPYSAIQKKDPPDEEYLKKYKPETEDFLTFICFRSTVPNYQNRLNETPKIEMEDSNSTTIIDCSSPSKTPDKKSPTINHNNTNDSQMSKHSTSSHNNNNNNNKTTASNSTSSPTIHMDTDSPLNQHRRPTRQSPRLASSNRKISENDSSNLTIISSNTMQANSVTYEEDMKRASIALEDMAHEMNSSDGIKNEPSSNGLESSKSFSSYKNNKHLVKGLMTREFAGGFADEETIFESISNHKL